MRKALVFVAAFALVLVAGAAVALMGSPGSDAADEKPLAIEEPTTTSSEYHEKEDPPKKEEPKKVEHEEEPPKEEPKKEEPKEEEKEEEPKEEKDTDPPDIVILYPENEQHFEKKEVVFEGKTEPGAKVLAGKYEADVDDEGNFRIVLYLTHHGWHTVTLKAVDEAGNKATDSVKVYFEKGEEEEPKEEHDFWVKQKFGSCSENPPYEKFYGEGTPGTEIWIGNKWGSASTTIGKKGGWDLKVKFPEMPCGTHEIVMETSEGVRKVFEFTYLCEEEGGHEEGGGEDK